MTAIPSDLVDASRNTDFTVIEPFPFTLRIGKHSTELAEVYKKMGVSSAGYLTAWNPYSSETKAKDNAAVEAEQARKVGRKEVRDLRAQVGKPPGGAGPDRS